MVPPPQREHHVDALRVVAFGLLILYHVAMVYVADWHFHVKSSYTAEWLQVPMVFMNRWRMPLLFLLSGVAIGLFRPERAPGRFVLMRTWRLLLPLVFGMFAVVPIQAYCQALANGAIAPGFSAFMVRYVQFGPWPAKAFDGWEFGVTWNHLWYLAYLWVYSLVLAALLPLLRTALAQRLIGAVGAMRGPWLVLLPAIPFATYAVTLAPRFPQTHDLLHDGFLHAQYFTVFAIGYAIARAPGVWSEVARLRRPLLLLALAVFAVYGWIVFAAARPLPGALVLAAQLLRGAYLWCALVAILGYGVAHLNRPFRWLPYASEAVYPWYILHQSFIVPIAFVLIPLQIGGAAEAALVLGGTLAGCLMLHHFVIRRVRWIRPLFGLKGRREKTRAACAGRGAAVRAAATGAWDSSRASGTVRGVAVAADAADARPRNA
jgi:surface polysaccharide O-acyltransferase-like enzyme